MSIYSVTPVSNFIDRQPLNALQAAIFHGIASRGGRQHPNETKVRISDKQKEPLSIIHSGDVLPDIFRPSSHLVVSERVRLALNNPPNVFFLPVIFAKIVSTNGLEWNDVIAFDGDANLLFMSLLESLELRKQVGPFYEMLTYRHQDLDVGDNPLVVTTASGTPPMDEEVEFLLSKQILSEFPCFWHEGMTIVCPPYSDVVLDYIDRRFFIVREISI